MYVHASIYMYVFIHASLNAEEIPDLQLSHLASTRLVRCLRGCSCGSGFTAAGLCLTFPRSMSVLGRGSRSRSRSTCTAAKQTSILAVPAVPSRESVDTTTASLEFGSFRVSTKKPEPVSQNKSAPHATIPLKGSPEHWATLTSTHYMRLLELPDRASPASERCPMFLGSGTSVCGDMLSFQCRVFETAWDSKCGTL